MNRISVDKLPSEPKSSNAEEEFSSEGWPVFPSPESKPSGSQQKREFVHDDVSALIPLDDAQIEMDYATLESLKSSPDSGAEAGQAHKARANWFGKKKNRQTVWFGPQDVVSADFCNAFIDFNTLRLELPYTGGEPVCSRSNGSEAVADCFSPQAWASNWPSTGTASRSATSARTSRTGPSSSSSSEHAQRRAPVRGR